MNAVYEINGYLGNNNYEFDNNPVWKGNFILDSDGWIKGVAYIKDKDQVKETLIFGNLLPNKMINFMITGDNIVMACLLMKTNKGYEGMPSIARYTVYEDGTYNMSLNRNETALAIIEERLDLSLDEIKNKADKILNGGLYLDFYNSVNSSRNERQQALESLYKQYKGNVKSLTRDII